MIPSELGAFLAAPRFCALGIVDDRGRPHLARCSGWYLGSAGGPDIVAIVHASFVPPLPAQRRRVSLLLNEADRFVAFQLKGWGTPRAATAEEDQRCRKMFEELGAVVERHWGLPVSLYTTITVGPSVAFEVFVEDCFAQSPGPGAGRRIGDAP